ncbi:nucleotide-binding protein [Roseateles oligotrophus]|uniref:Nucleotide-binding protein n=1 Tax=Roseateles oligotrophus TaxID=1769250 RepID=A0ABT2Y8X1_9BURK|nr:nucleotide-binding protein [Roseateles oligotrophus]MCV2366736.1 nucleotide-binding protein [Roseateles oligotrophus]
MRQKPTLFIGSSTQGSEIAYEIQAQLKSHADTTVWNQGLFELSSGTLEQLDRSVQEFDFAVLVLSTDDFVLSKGGEAQAPRDNVIFELGLFMGRLGRNRTFVVRSEQANFKLPSDLAGITLATYDPQRAAANLAAALGPACNEIRKSIARERVRDELPSDQVIEEIHCRGRFRDSYISTDLVLEPIEDAQLNAYEDIEDARIRLTADRASFVCSTSLTRPGEAKMPGLIYGLGSHFRGAAYLQYTFVHSDDPESTLRSHGVMSLKLTHAYEVKGFWMATTSRKGGFLVGTVDFVRVK